MPWFAHEAQQEDDRHMDQSQLGVPAEIYRPPRPTEVLAVLICTPPSACGYYLASL